MDKILKESKNAFSVRFGPVELFECPPLIIPDNKKIETCDFSVGKGHFSEKIDFADESLELSLKREDESSYGSYEKEMGVSESSSKFLPGKNFPCPYKNCKKVYTSSYGLKYHMDHGHTAEKSNEKRPYSCMIDGCGKTYKNNNGLKYHIQHAHKGHSYSESEYFM